jgi:hypothetical protein
MSELQTIQQPPAMPEPEDPDTEEEFKALYTDATEGRDRFEVLAKAADAAGHPEIAKVYREVSGTVMGLLVDIVGASANALISVEDAIDALPGGGDGGSSLTREDADKYIALFDQYLRLLDGLDSLVPAGPEGEKQHEVFATLRRLTSGMVEFTESIVDGIADADADPDDDDEDPEE